MREPFYRHLAPNGANQLDVYISPKVFRLSLNVTTHEEVNNHGKQDSIQVANR